jgi:prepilin-type N-terminal cleavage/methylation domain-containing protein
MREFRTLTRRAFTLVELLIVVAIIAALIAILVPGLSAIRRQANKAAAVGQLSALRTGLDQYFADFNMYPPSTLTANFGTITPQHGSSMLAEGLLGYLPGNIDGGGTSVGDPNDMGFRTNRNAAAMGGRLYGPYAPSDPKNFSGKAFVDPWQNEVLYYRSTQAASGLPPTTAPTGNIFGTANSYFISTDCASSTASDTGSTANPPPSALNPKGTLSFYSLIGGSNSASIGGPVSGSSSYLLISAGSDEIYFTADDVVVSK